MRLTGTRYLPTNASMSTRVAPVMFCYGTKDAFASPEGLEAVCGAMPAASVHLLEGADHGFNVRKASGRTREDVYREAAQALEEWLKGLA